MTDKEERILITKCSGWCHALRISCDPFDDDDGMYCDKIGGKWVRITEKDCAKCKAPVLLGLSRSEAIERMAKGLCAENLSHSCEDCMRNGTNDCFINEKEDFYKSLAEAALNALLEDNNGN